MLEIQVLKWNMKPLPQQLEKIKFIIAIAASMSLIAVSTGMMYWPVLVVSGYREVLGPYYTMSYTQFDEGLFPHITTLLSIWFDSWPQGIGWFVLACAISRPLIASILAKPNESILLVAIACVTVLLAARPCGEQHRDTRNSH